MSEGEREREREGGKMLMHFSDQGKVLVVALESGRGWGW